MISDTKYLLEVNELKEIKKLIIMDMIKDLDGYYYNEPALHTTVWNFLDNYRNNISISKDRNKSKSDLAWRKINEEYKLTKLQVSKILKKIIADDYKRKSILRDIGDSYALETLGFYKMSLILVGSILEEIIRLLLDALNLRGNKNTFNEYIKICNDKHIFKTGINNLNNFVRQYRNFVHLAKEKEKSDVINKPNAKNALASLFTVISELKSIEV